MTRSHRNWGWFLNFGNFGGYGNFGNSSCLRGRCCLSDYGAYVRFRAITGDLLPSLTPLTLCFKGVGLGFSILAISAITAIAISSSFALTCPGLPWIRGQTFPDPRSSAFIRGRILISSAYSVSSVFQRCWGWFVNFGNCFIRNSSYNAFRYSAPEVLSYAAFIPFSPDLRIRTHLPVSATHRPEQWRKWRCHGRLL